MDYAKKCSPEELLKYIDDLKKAYYYGTPKVSDDVYDAIVELLPHGVKPGVGFKVPSTYKDKTKLPYWMSSLDKIKSGTGDIKKFAGRGPYLMMDKLDGLSGLLVVKGESRRLYTRGSGDEGRDVSYLIPYLSMPSLPTGVYRGELIMSKSSFRKYVQRVAPDAKNARTSAVGLINHKNPNLEALKYIDFIIYEVISDSETQCSPHTQLLNLQLADIDRRWIVWYRPAADLLDDQLTVWTVKRIEESEYDIDGLVIIRDAPYTRVEDDNPDYARAYKIVKDGVETRVIEVQWKISAYGYLKPTVYFEPINIDGLNLNYATGHNAKYISDHNIGPDAVIRVTRSNDVIPYVLGVVRGTTAQMPEVDYEWTDTGVDAVTVGVTNDEKLQQLVYFFKEIGCQFFGEKIIERCVHAGYTTVAGIIECTTADFMDVKGVEQRMAAKIYTNIREALGKCGEPAIMSASLKFGRNMGKKRLQLFLDAYPNWDQPGNAPEYDGLMQIEGYSNKTVDALLEGLPKFREFLSDLPPPYNRIETYRAGTAKPAPAKKDGAMTGQKVVVTGFRSKELESWIVREGGELLSGVSKKTTLLLTKDHSASTKTQKAQELGIPVVLVKDFCKQYGITGGFAPARRIKSMCTPEN